MRRCRSKPPTGLGVSAAVFHLITLPGTAREPGEAGDYGPGTKPSPFMDLEASLPLWPWTAPAQPR